MSRLRDLHDAVVARLQADPTLPRDRIFSRRMRDASTQLEEALARGSLGIAVLPPLIRRAAPATSGPYVDRVEITVRVIATALLEPAEGEADAWSAAESIIRSLHAWEPMYADRAQQIAGTVCAVEDVMRDGSEDDTLIFDLVFQTHLPL